MKDTTKKRSRLNQQRARRREHRIKKRLARPREVRIQEPVISQGRVSYEVSERTRALVPSGVPALKDLARKVGLDDAINKRVPLLKLHCPYSESDHIFNIAFCLLAGGRSLEDIKRLRQDEAYLDALGAERLPDATTAGDFLRRFSEYDVEKLMDCINRSRLTVWNQQPAEFLDQAIIEADGHLAATDGERKLGADMAYEGTWGYHPLLVSLANTSEPLFLVNRPGNRPSSEGAATRFDSAIALCREAGFKRILLRGDTDFSQTAYLDGWSGLGVEFVFGMDAGQALVARAKALSEESWSRLERQPKYEVKTESRARRPNVKEEVVRTRGYKNIILEYEDVAEFDHRPVRCHDAYRIVVVRKRCRVEKGQDFLFHEDRYLFYITNVRTLPKEEIVRLANERCDQENLIKQLKQVGAFDMPVHDLVSNWAYMVIASLAWSLKIWFALLLPEKGRWRESRAAEKRELLRMSFQTFLNTVVRVPAQVVRTGRRVVLRLLAWTPWQRVVLRGYDALSQPLRC